MSLAISLLDFGEVGMSAVSVSWLAVGRGQSGEKGGKDEQSVD
jgi:hypothetical protein